MTVEELIQVLRGYPSDMRVVIAGYEAGWDDIAKHEIIKVALNHEDGGGVYGVHLSEDWDKGAPLTEVLALGEPNR